MHRVAKSSLFGGVRDATDVWHYDDQVRLLEARRERSKSGREVGGWRWHSRHSVLGVVKVSVVLCVVSELVCSLRVPRLV